MDSAILKTLTGSTTAKLKNEVDLRRADPSSYTATFTGVNKVYSLFPGTVLFLGYYKGLGTVTVKVSPYELIRYCNLTDMRVWYNSEVETTTFLGIADPHKGLQLEYCTSGPETSKFPVRINETTYYKQNPIKLLDGEWTPQQPTEATEYLSFPSNTIELTNDEILEWGIPRSAYGTDPDKIISNLNDMPESTIYMLSDNKGD